MAKPGRADAVHLLLPFEDVLRAIRADLGHSNVKLRRGDLLRMFINDLPEKL